MQGILIFRHFYAILEHIFYFLDLENGLFQTHPLNLEFQIFNGG